MATSQTWMEGFQTRARAALETALSRLDPEWAILAELRIDGPDDEVAADYVAIHPALGIALIDVGSTKAVDPTERLRTLLDAQKFAAIFPGNLPIVHLAVRPADGALIGRRLDAAFAKAPQLTVRNPDWAAAVQDLLVPFDATAPEPAAAPASAAKPQPSPAATPERRPPAPEAKTRAAPSKPQTEAPTTAAQAAWNVAQGAKPAPEQPRVDRRDASPPAGSATKPAAPAPEQPPVSRQKLDRGNAAPPAHPVPSPVPSDKKSAAAAPAASISAAGRQPVPSDASPTRAPKGTERGFDAARAQTVAEPAETPAPLPSSFEPGADAPRLERPIANDGRSALQPLRLDHAGDIPRARAVSGGELVARPDDAIVGPPPTGPAPQWQQWAVAAVVVFVLGGASWWVFKEMERPATPAAGRAVADIAPSPTLEKPPAPGNVVPSPAAPSIAPPAPQTGTVAGLSPPSGSADADRSTAPSTAPSAAAPSVSPPAPQTGTVRALSRPSGSAGADTPTAWPNMPSATAPSDSPPAPQTGTIAALSPPSGSADADKPTPPPTMPSATAPSVSPPAPQTGTVAALSPPSGNADADMPKAPPASTSPPSPALASPAPLATLPAESVIEKPTTATPPTTAPAPPAASVSPSVAAKSSTPPPAAPRPRPAFSKPALASAKPSIATPSPERGATPPVSETRSASVRGSNPRRLPASARDDAPPFSAADLPPLDPAPAPSPASTAVAAAAPVGLHGPTNLLPSASVASATSPAPPMEVCRAYTSTKTLLGQPRPVSGVTCRGQDGQWHIITELPN
jgi:hypothetical protein